MTFSSKIGFGKQVSGMAVLVANKNSELGSRDLTMDYQGKILILAQSPTREFLEKARFVGVVGIVTPEIHYRDFVYFSELGDFAMMIVQGFGCQMLSKENLEKFGKLDGKDVILNGETHELKTA